MSHKSPKFNRLCLQVIPDIDRLFNGHSKLWQLQEGCFMILRLQDAVSIINLNQLLSTQIVIMWQLECCDNHNFKGISKITFSEVIKTWNNS